MRVTALGSEQLMFLLVSLGLLALAITGALLHVRPRMDGGSAQTVQVSGRTNEVGATWPDCRAPDIRAVGGGLSRNDRDGEA